MKKQVAYRAVSILLILLVLLPSPLGSATQDITLYGIPSVTARSAIVIDLETGDVLFQKDPDTWRPPASMSKNMTAYIIYEEIAAGRLTLDTMIRVGQNAVHMSRTHDWHPATVFHTVGAYYSVETMLQLIMLPSHNGACVAMAEHISGSQAAFVERMNQTAERMGIDIRYDNVHGVWGNQATARGMVQLVRNFIIDHPDILRITSLRVITFRGASVANTNHLLAAPHVDGFKTGTTGPAGPCLSSTAFQGDNRVVAVVMNAASRDARFSDSRRILDFGLAELERRDERMSSISTNITSNAAEVRRNTDIHLAARLENVNTEYFSALGGGWRVNGETVSTFGPFRPIEQRTFTHSHFLPADSPEETLEIEFFANLPGDLTSSASLSLPVSNEPPAMFRDLHGHWAYHHVERAVERGLFSGVSANHFAPNGQMTRAMFVTVLGRMAEQMGILVSSSGTTPFQDVSVDAWYSAYVTWAWEEGIVQGISPARFGTENIVTRQQVAPLFYRFMQHYNIELPGEIEAAFPDLADTSPWAIDAIKEAVRVGLITGYADGRLAPGNTATRAQVAVMFLRFLDAYEALPPPPDCIEPEADDEGPEEDETPEIDIVGLWPLLDAENLDA